MAEGGEVPKDETDENTGAKHRDFNSSREMNEMLNDRGLSEESITERRHFVKLLNVGLNTPMNLNQINVAYLSGSFAEGLVGVQELTSDIDIMAIHPYNVIQSANELNPQHRYPLNNGVYALEDSISQPLFKRLRHIMGGDNRKLYQHQNGYFYLSNSEMKREIYSLRKKFVPSDFPFCEFDICGPSVNLSFPGRQSRLGQISDFDYVVTVPCPFWPRDINEWFVRERKYQWPPLSRIHSIKKNGCLLVGKGWHDSTEQEIEWRISFSIAETVIIKSFNNTQMKCYYLMKTFLKRVLKPRYPNVLCSYHMKTALFWVCEETCSTFFKENALIDCFLLCINKLRFFLLQKHYPCYFRKDINLLSNRLVSTEYIEIIEFLYPLSQQGVVDLLKPFLIERSLSNYPESVDRKVLVGIDCPMQYFRRVYSYVNSIKNENNAIKLQNIFICSIPSFINKMSNLLELDFNCLKILSDVIVPDISCIALAALFKRQKNNKDHYRLQKHYISMLSRDLSVESSTSVLKRATVHYKIGKINECMVLVVNIIEKLSFSDVVYLSLEPNFENGALKFNGLKLLTLTDLKFARNITFSPLEVTLVPEFIRLEMDVKKTTIGYSTKGWAFIDSIIYAYSLAILCQHYISDFNTRDDFLQQLRELYVKRYFDLGYPESAKRAINYFYERFRIP